MSIFGGGTVAGLSLKGDGENIKDWETLQNAKSFAPRVP